jgi:virulence-associated protein VapD
MEYLITLCLTLIVFCSIIVILKKKQINSFSKIVYRQSDMHNILKDFFFKDIDNDKVFMSQSKIWRERQTTKVVILEKKAYWISNNIFYVGEAVDGKVKPETGQPLDTSNMSKREIDKMLFILDNLKNGKLNDSGSAGN